MSSPMQNSSFHAPLDPECPEVVAFYDGHDNDPISQMCGCMDEIIADFERDHRMKCERCRLFGCANIEVVDG